MTKQKGKVPVTMRALIARINRKLAHEDQMLRATRGDGRARQELGDHFIVNVRHNGIDDNHVDPVELGRELGVLREWEHVVEEGK